ncbi:Ubiquitin-conjugating enzyme family protein [Aphelenchoides avenae]|nr:Ubiquitin-conjugating enzyme family protein [Aphelenchus avenae]
MLEQLRRPPKTFEGVIRRHFWLKRDEICEQVQAWIADLEHHIKSVSGASNGYSTGECEYHLAHLKANFKDLEAELREMKAPEGLENVRPMKLDKTDATGLPDDQQPGPSGMQRTSSAPSTSKAKDRTVAA